LACQQSAIWLARRTNRRSLRTPLGNRQAFVRRLLSFNAQRWRTGNGNSDGNGRTILPSSRSESVRPLVPATPGSLADTIELRGIRLGARGRPPVFSPFPETSAHFGDAHKVWMVNFRVRDLDKMAAQLQAAAIEVKMDPQSYPNGRFARVHDPEGNPIELWQPAKPAAPG